MYYFIMLCVATTSYAGGFFGQAWIHQEGDFLSVNADKVDTAALLNEWCGMCGTQCVIDHDIKHKLSMSLTQVSCEQLLSEIVSSANMSWTQHGEVYLFSKSNKGQWVAYSCRNRKASELEALLKPLLTPAAKGERMLSDDVSQVLWVPKTFFLQHKDAIDALDQKKMVLSIHVSFLEQMEPFVQHSESLSPDAATLSKWLLGEPVTESWLTVLGWISGLVETGTIRYIAHTDLTLMEGVVGEYKVMIHDDGRSKKKASDSVGALSVHFNQLNPGRIEIKLEFKNESQGQRRSEVRVETAVNISPEDSILIGGSTQSKVLRQHQCPVWAQKLIRLHPILCKMTKHRDQSQSFIALTVHQL